MDMSLSNAVNSIGLAADIGGVMLVWKFGLPESVDRHGATYLITEEVDHSERDKAAKYDRLSKLGLGLIVLGFAVQLASNFINA